MQGGWGWGVGGMGHPAAPLCPTLQGVELYFRYIFALFVQGAATEQRELSRFSLRDSSSSSISSGKSVLLT